MLYDLTCQVWFINYTQNQSYGVMVAVQCFWLVTDYGLTSDLFNTPFTPTLLGSDFGVLMNNFPARYHIST